ncbi:unnamed protein product [Arabidopsis thaliana]|nr:glycine-rich protein [Arabidopsis thaliana]KAG7626415.1 hypothetical protein ISN45_At03g025690 [Arabidopsis thaliana x Arabidopsis arenosa]KAG7632400.1 hypothetical protein ISN44_As03g025410 [Arabidopsis suecica]AAR23712.1 At3g24250 [Arabidopsis thaliana]AEE76879.1 glycine-rich protein [Arabidopsis thaliana]OAP06806.1 hypothetical protein AXX17_AT3G26220 [Arabidopsis thaliana]|eukprot:NP_189067.1 glycine-rich protein [Arabidopsis thaliana]
MAMRFSSLTKIVLLSAAMLLLVHASARTLQQTQTLPLQGGGAAPTKDEPHMVNAPLEDQKNFIYGGGIGGVAGVGGFMGMPGGGSGGSGMTFPLPSGTPLLGGAGGLGGLGGAMGFPGGLGGGPSGGGVPSSSGGSP